ncbi:hypothetical protein [Sphingobacterium sp. UBA5670]|uniref:hypothetical protein n=1 Tax=Sphingobacterium sp. UBA5670 TaxID=1947502 RepID=UPI0025F112CB|nr:hypothetical protein [Sphingobacterium sp. UBA5670]
MKILLICLVLFSLFFTQRTYGQTPNFKEWFRQKKTQKEYLLKQIAALEAYINLGKKGYKIYKSGLNSINQFTKGEFNLHNDYFNSLKRINPAISTHPRVMDIIKTEQKIGNIIHELKEMINADPLLTLGQKQSMLQITLKMKTESQKLLEELITTVDPGVMELKDDERITRINKILNEILLLYQSTQNLRREIILFQRSTEQKLLENQTMKNINEQ